MKEALHNDAAYLDAEHKRRENWEKLISKSRFEARALITTAVQDNGINVWDDSVRNLVVMTDIRPSEG